MSFDFCPWPFQAAKPKGDVASYSHNLAEFSRSETLFSSEFLSVKWQI